MDYKKMYAILCGAVDDVIDDLNQVPLARPAARRLQKALLDAEEVGITSDEPTLRLLTPKDDTSH